MGAGRYFLCVIKEGNQKRVVTGGHEEPSFDEIAAAALSRDGNRYGYLARRGEQWFCVVDGVQSPFDADHSKLGRQWRFTFSPDGKRYAFICQRREQWVVFLDGRELHAGEGIVCSSILFSPDGRHVVFVRQKQDKSETVVFDGVESRPYDGATMPAFSADSRHFGYTARFGDHWFVLVDGRETECKGLRFLDYPELTLSPDGRKYVYCRKRGYMQPDEIVVGGEDAHQVETGKYGIWGGHLVFSPDGRRFAYAARHFVVVDGLPGKEYRDVEEVLFTPDSKHVVSKVWKEEPRRNPTQFIVVDGSESRLYDDILYNNYREYVVFDSATAFHTIAVRDERYYLVEFRICGRWRAMLHYVCHLDIGDEWRRIVSACEQIETLILPPDS
jgi:dipeptidyl aminopeptidase/acylaminoacyl peptidase